MLMDVLLKNLPIELSANLYLKDPETTDLGKRIVKYSIELIYELGFEQFTFKKLGILLKSNESSIYRYFENKHRLLLYLTNWYWSGLENLVVVETGSITDPWERLQCATAIITAKTLEDSTYEHINEVLLKNIVIAENTKAHHTKEVDAENKEGLFAAYKRLTALLRDMIIAASPDYEYPSSLASMVIEGSLHQHFLKSHFKLMTDCNEQVPPAMFFKDLITRQLSPTHGR